MGTNPALQAGRVANRVISLLAGLALAVLIVQHSITRRAEQEGETTC